MFYLLLGPSSQYCIIRNSNRALLHITKEHTYVILGDVTCSRAIAYLATTVKLQINVVRECPNCKMSDN